MDGVNKQKGERKGEEMRNMKKLTADRKSGERARLIILGKKKKMY